MGMVRVRLVLGDFVWLGYHPPLMFSIRISPCLFGKMCISMEQGMWYNGQEGVYSSGNILSAHAAARVCFKTSRHTFRWLCSSIVK